MRDIFEDYMMAYQKAPQNIQQLIDTEEIGEFADAIITQYSIPATTKRPLIIIVSNRVLGIITDQDITTSLQELTLSPEVVAGLTAKIGTFVQSKTGTTVQPQIPVPTAPVQTIPKPATLAEQARATATIPIPPILQKQGIPTFRTMAGDMAKTQSSGDKVYTSTQDAILKEGWSTPK